MKEYDVYCDFDIGKHKKTFVNYLEVLILEDGKVVYAVPSHQRKAENLACEKLNISRGDLISKFPIECVDYLEWLLGLTNSVCVWDDFYIVGKNGLNFKQKNMLKKLKLNGLYKGGL